MRLRQAFLLLLVASCVLACEPASSHSGDDDDEQSEDSEAAKQEQNATKLLADGGVADAGRTGPVIELPTPSVSYSVRGE